MCDEKCWSASAGLTLVPLNTEGEQRMVEETIRVLGEGGRVKEGRTRNENARKRAS